MPLDELTDPRGHYAERCLYTGGKWWWVCRNCGETLGADPAPSYWWTCGWNGYPDADAD